MQQTFPGVNLNNDTDNGKRPSANIILLPTQKEAQEQAYADASTSGARVFLSQLYKQGGRYHLVFSLPFNLLVELARLQSADRKKNKSNAENSMNRPEMPQHTNEIAKYLIETDNYILPPFVFNCNTPIKVFSYGTGAVKVGYAVIPSNVELFVTDGQHRLKALQKVLSEKPELGDDSATVLVVQEDNMEQIHQDFADCAKNKPIPPALLTAFDVTDILSRLTRQIAKELVIFEERIDKISGKIGKDPNYLFTMNQLKIGIAEFLFGSSRKQVIESRSNQNKSEFLLMLERTKTFYTEFAKNNEVWKILLQPASQNVNLNLYAIRQQRIDFNSVGFQIISRVGHFIFFGQEFTDVERETLIKVLASLDYSRDAALWENNVVTMDEDKEGNPIKKIVNQSATVDKGVKVAIRAVKEQTGITLL